MSAAICSSHQRAIDAGMAPPLSPKASGSSPASARPLLCAVACATGASGVPTPFPFFFLDDDDLAAGDASALPLLAGADGCAGDAGSAGA